MTTIKVLHYEIDYSPKGRLGKGSFGLVYKAKNINTSEMVAVKILDVKELHRNKYTFKRIQDEINSMKVTVEQYTNGNPNIIRFYDAAEVDDQVFIFEEFCRGGSLQNMIYREGPLQDKYCKKFLRQIIEGVRFLHSNNIVHRDLKPDNLMMTTSNPETAVVKIIDFGLSRKVADSNLGGTICGSPGYMAPEVLLLKQNKQNKKYGLKVDLWSVGAILYTMITGRKIHVEDVRKDLQSLPPHVTKECKEVLYGLLKTNADDRMTCEEILNHSYLLPPRPSCFDNNNNNGEEDGYGKNNLHEEGGGKISPNLTISAGKTNNNNLLNYQASTYNQLSPIKSCDSTSQDFSIATTNNNNNLLKKDDDDDDIIVRGANDEDDNDNIKNGNMNVASVNDLHVNVNIEESNAEMGSRTNNTDDNDLNDSFVDEWSMVELSEEEKARTFLKPTVSEIKNKPTSSFMETSSTIIKDTMRKVLKKASGADAGLSSSGSGSSTSSNGSTSSSKNGSVLTNRSSSSSSVVRNNNGTSINNNMITGTGNNASSNIITAATSTSNNNNNKASVNENNYNDENNNKNDEENSPPSHARNNSNNHNNIIQQTTDSNVDNCCKEAIGNDKNNNANAEEEISESSLLYSPENIAKRLSNVSSDKPESPMLVVNSVSNSSQITSRIASSDNYRNGVWSMSYKSFQVGDAAIFIKNLQYENVYTMFQHGAKHPIFLNEDCIDIFNKYFLTDTTTTLPNVISGRIILIEDDQKATRHDNPYHLPHSGDVFGTVTVERLTESVIRNIEPSADRNFSTDVVACGTTNLFVLRADDGVQKGVYIMLRHTDKNGSDGVPYFLDLECVAAINSRMKYVPNYILGETICVEERIASGNDQWGVAAGERYGLCTVTPL